MLALWRWQRTGTDMKRFRPMVLYPNWRKSKNYRESPACNWYDELAAFDE